VRIGLPAGIQSAVFSLANIVIQSAINSLGTTVMAASSAGISIESVVYNLLNSFSQACTTFVGQNNGARQLARCRSVFKVSLAEGFIADIAVILLVLVFGHQMIALFNGDPEVIELGYTRISIIISSYVFSMLYEVTSGYLRGFGISVVPAIITFCRYLRHPLLLDCLRLPGRSDLPHDHAGLPDQPGGERRLHCSARAFPPSVTHGQEGRCSEGSGIAASNMASCHSKGPGCRMRCSRGLVVDRKCPLALEPGDIGHAVERDEGKKDWRLLHIGLILGVFPVVPVLPELEPAGAAEHHVDDASISCQGKDPLEWPFECREAGDEDTCPGQDLAEIVRAAHEGVEPLVAEAPGV
jgi:hypothetical protein